jgi:hypothetical protein
MPLSRNAPGRGPITPSLPSAAPAPTQRVMQLDASNNLKTLFATPAWPTPGLCSAFSALGTASILRLDADRGFAAELVGMGRGCRLGWRVCCSVDLACPS